ncbi:hypothetical protein ASF10_22405 [Flavobacterium sp. Leaf82]|uniref:hypothetical protein n=1 Tax=unclassified Flavobacterium TaxID=196869 RepID=UPI0006F72098|nr:hypothetical protein [Flavobacterium sp. Leaf82]KQO30756.1 hypothetical protein ASF10_22405 [Flavobacterium sp. Leaf82]
MFDSIAEWVKDNIFNSFQVLINVLAEIRLSRDQESKNIFKNGIMNDEILRVSIKTNADGEVYQSIKSSSDFIPSLTEWKDLVLPDIIAAS